MTYVFWYHGVLLSILVMCQCIFSNALKRCPNGLVLNEVFTLGVYGACTFSGNYPFIELSRASNEEISLTNYSLMVFSVSHKNHIRLRAVMDLKTYKFTAGQKIGVIGDGSFPNQLFSNDINSRNLIYNDNLNNLNYLSITKAQHLVVSLIHSDVGSVFDQQVLIDGENNVLDENTWTFVKKNIIDLVVIRGPSATKTFKALNLMLQESVGPKQLQYITTRVEKQ